MAKSKGTSSKRVKDRRKAKPSKKGECCQTAAVGIPETIPTCPTGVPCIIGRDANQILTCWPLPLNERYVKASRESEVIFTNT